MLDGLKRFGERAEDPKVLLAAAKLLGILWNRWNRVEQHVKIEIARYAVRSGTSLSGVLFTLKDAGTQTITEALAAVVRRHVIAEHLVIAGRKIALSGKYTYRFVIEDGVLSDGVVAEYGYTNPRLRNLATFLTDAKLVDVAGRITPKGLGLLNEFQPA